MRDDSDDLVSLGRGLTVLATCLVQEMSRSDPTFQARFLKRLEEAYCEVRNHNSYDPGLALALLASTRSLITGLTLQGVQESPFLADR